MRSIFLAIGISLLMTAILMLVPIFVSWIYNEDLGAFLISIIITSISGVILIFFGKAEGLLASQVTVVTVGAWLVVGVFSSLPFYFVGFTYTDAFFEAMSGITTTGSTILSSVEGQTKAVLMWRAMLHGIGGLGIIVCCIVMISVFSSVDNLHLFHSESSEMNSFGSTKKMAHYILYIYLIMLTTCGVLYFIAGMNTFDAICHSLATVSTGGFANYDNSFTHYHSYIIDYIAILFMLMGALPFALYVKLASGDLSIVRDEQVRCFIMIIMVFSIPVFIDAYVTDDLHIEQHNVFNSIRLALFNVVSIATSTGFIEEDYSSWNVGSANLVLFLLVFVGGCIGSTAGGVKVFRIILLFKHSFVTIKHILTPHKVELICINGHVVPKNVLGRAYSFFFIFIVLYFISATLISLSGLGFTASLSAAASAIGNSGPGIGSIVGPYGNYSSLGDINKWLLSILMMIGRLEIFTMMAFITAIFKAKEHLQMSD